MAVGGFVQGYLENAYKVIEMVWLKGQAMNLAATLPHGGKRKLELAILLASDPELLFLFLDEPTAGMVTEQVPELITLIRSIQGQGNKTIVLVKHNMNVVMNISDNITVMHHGAVLANGTSAEVSADKTVQSVYLGELYSAFTS